MRQSRRCEGITALDSQQLAKEKGVGALAARMGTAALVATVVLWIAWFFLPAVTLEFFVLNRSFTFWEFLAMDTTNPQSPIGSRGLLGLLGLLAIAAPVARPFIRHAKARYLNVAPLAFLVVGRCSSTGGSHVAAATSVRAPPLPR